MIESIDELDGFFMSYMPQRGVTGKLRDSRLERMESLLKALGNPERDYKTIHIAGSKGKGTTATIIARALSTGRKTGLYRSPHVYDLRERFTLSGKFFDDRLYIEAANILERTLTALEFRPTTFELYTAFAYILFSISGCEYAVIETGLGGRLDATNTVESIAEVLLPVELEHVDVLGDTIEKIAIEKSKIIKGKSVVAVSDVKDEAYSVFRKEAERMDCQFYSFRDNIKSFYHEDRKDFSLSTFKVGGVSYRIKSRIRSMEIGKNIAVSVLLLSKLSLLSDEAIREIEGLTIEGRFEERKEGGKEIVLDVSHTK